MNDDSILLFETQDLILINYLEYLLQKEEIPYFKKGEYLKSLVGALPYDCSFISIHIPKAFYLEGEELLKKMN
jgi:hypothetical protein